MGYKLTWTPSPSLFPLDESVFSKDGSTGDRDDDEHPLYKTLFNDDDLNDDYDDDDSDDDEEDDEGAIDSKSPARKRSVFLDHVSPILSSCINFVVVIVIIISIPMRQSQNQIRMQVTR